MIGGFLRMNLPKLQFVVIDDGTPNGERSDLERLQRELEPLGHVFQTQINAGPGMARNRAASLARHDLLLFFDADNVPFPDMVERLCRAMSGSRADSVAAPYFLVPPMKRRPLPEDVLGRFQPQGGPVALGLLDHVVGDVCSLVRREMFEALGGFSDERNSWEDWEFFLRALGTGYRHFVYPDPLFYYTVDVNGRNSRAQRYANRKSLLGCLNQMPVGVVADAARAFALDVSMKRGIL
jgi:GT2 family glycosyltransferase